MARKLRYIRIASICLIAGGTTPIQQYHFEGIALPTGKFWQPNISMDDSKSMDTAQYLPEMHDSLLLVPIRDLFVHF